MLHRHAMRRSSAVSSWAHSSRLSHYAWDCSCGAPRTHQHDGGLLGECHVPGVGLRSPDAQQHERGCAGSTHGSGPCDSGARRTGASGRPRRSAHPIRQIRMVGCPGQCTHPAMQSSCMSYTKPRISPVCGFWRRSRHAGLDASVCLLLYVLARNLFSARVGVGAAWLYAVLPIPAIASLALLPDALGPFWLALVLALASAARPGRNWPMLLAGLAAGAACYFRTELLLLLVPVTVALLCRHGRWRVTLTWSAVAMLVTLATLTPWLWWTRQQTGTALLARRASARRCTPASRSAATYPGGVLGQLGGTRRPRARIRLRLVAGCGPLLPPRVAPHRLRSAGLVRAAGIGETPVPRPAARLRANSPDARPAVRP